MYRVACNDSDMWVSTIADILKTFPSTGFLNSEVKESQGIFHEVISDLKKLGELFSTNYFSAKINTVYFCPQMVIQNKNAKCHFFSQLCSKLSLNQSN